MNVTAKSRYALKVMIDLAVLYETHGPHKTKNRKDLSSSNKISLNFFDQVLFRLRSKELIHSVRGSKGGLQLKKSPHLITVFDILIAVEDQLYPVRCITGECSIVNQCISHDAWHIVTKSFTDSLKSQNLLTLATSWTHKQTYLTPPLTPTIRPADLNQRIPCRVPMTLAPTCQS